MNRFIKCKDKYIQQCFFFFLQCVEFTVPKISLIGVRMNPGVAGFRGSSVPPELRKTKQKAGDEPFKPPSEKIEHWVHAAVRKRQNSADHKRKIQPLMFTGVVERHQHYEYMIRPPAYKESDDDTQHQYDGPVFLSAGCRHQRQQDFGVTENDEHERYEEEQNELRVISRVIVVRLGAFARVLVDVFLCFGCHGVSQRSYQTDDPGTSTGGSGTPKPPTARQPIPSHHHHKKAIECHGRQKDEAAVDAHEVGPGHDLTGNVTEDPVVEILHAPERQRECEQHVEKC